MKQLFDRVDEATANRNGGPRKDRPDAVDSLLSGTFTPGFKQGEPIANVGYSDYPTDRTALLRPEAGEVLRQIADRVDSMEQLAEELGMNQGDLLDTAVDIHGIDLPDSVEPDTTVEVPDGDGGTIEIRKEEYDQFPNLFHLYSTLGLGAKEIGTVVEQDEREVRKALNRNNLL